ncbi:HD-GYP domain-containing protein [Desulfobaculum sp.]
MIKKIAAEELRPGMYVVDTGLSWMDYPFLYAEEGEIASAEQVERIATEYTEAFVDTERGAAALREGGDDGFAEAASTGRAWREERVPIAQEMEHVRTFYADSVTFAREFMTEVSTGGKVDYERSGVFVEEVIDSVTRNRDALVSMTKLRSSDEYTYTHCINVSVLATAFGDEMGLPHEDLMDLGLAGLMHDLGKALIPPMVLNKPGKLTDAEFDLIRKHPQRSITVLGRLDAVPRRVLRGVLEHHEKYNGGGYPAGLMGDDIHLFARYISLADVYDALTSARAYKSGMPPHKALRIIYSMRGQDFHPGNAERFIKVIGIYPVGSLVQLEDGRYAVVSGSNPQEPLRPRVTLALGPDGRPIHPRPVDLAQPEGDGVAIASCMDAAAFGLRAEDYLL